MVTPNFHNKDTETNSTADSAGWVEISRGASARTVLFNDPEGQREICKRLSVDETSGNWISEQMAEIEAIEQLAIEGFCKFHKMQQDEGDLRLFRHFVEGESLRDQLATAKPLEHVLSLGIQLAKATHQLHRLGFTHKNLKPSNIILSRQGQVILVDGLINPFANVEQIDAAADVKDVVYASPEQLGLVEQQLGPSSDLYAIGIVLYECFCGRVPFQANDVGRLMFEKMSAPIESLTEYGVNAPRVLDELMQRVLRKDPRDRYQTALALAEDLERLLAAVKRGLRNPCLALGTTDIRSTLVEANFIGRDPELNQLQKELESTHSGDAGFVVIDAESGCGKTRLLDEFQREARVQGCRSFRGTGQHQVAAGSYHLLEEMIESLTAECQAQPQLLQHLKAHLSDDQAAIVQALPQLSTLLGESSDANLGPDAFGEARSINAICQLFSLLGDAETPCVLLFDDCQWVDESTLKLLRQWRRVLRNMPAHQRHVMVVVAFRADEVTEGHPLRQLSPSTQLRLEQLSPGDIEALALSMAGPLPGEAREVVKRMAGGSPFMATAVLRGMVETEVLESVGDRWQVNESALEDLQSSDDAGDFLSRRIALLSDELLKILMQGAVLGKQFDVASIAAITETPLERAQTALNEAQDKNLVWVHEDTQRCHFVHDKIRASLLARLTPEQEKSLHLKTARYYEKKAGHHVVELAYHFDAAGESQGALEYALAAANQARAQWSTQLAEQQYRIAQRAESSDERVRYRIAKGLGEVLMLRGNYDEAQQALDEAERLASSKDNRSWITGKLGELAFKRGDMETATVRLEASLRELGTFVPKSELCVVLCFLWEAMVQVLHSLLPSLFVGRLKRLPNNHERLHFHLLSRYGHGCWFARSKSRCLWVHFRSMNAVEKFPPTPELARCYSEHAPAMSLIPWSRRGIEYARKSLEIRKSLNDVWGQGQSLHYYGIVLFAAARFEECIEKCREAVRLLEKTGDYWEMHIARYQIAASLYYLGDLDAAQREARSLHESGLELGDYQASALSLDVWARTSLSQPAKTVFDKELKRHRVDAQGSAQLLLGMGVQLLGSGKAEEAAHCFRRALRTARTSGIRNAYVMPNFAWLSTALRCQAESTATYHPALKSKLLAASQKVARKLILVSWPMKHNLPHALRELGLTTAMQGNPGRANHYLRKSVKIARKLKLKHEESLTRIALKIVNHRRDASEQISQRIERVRNAAVLFRSGVRGSEPRKKMETLSLADRFNRVMTSGRAITSALNEASILDRVRSAAMRLLRGQRCYILEGTAEASGRPGFQSPDELSDHERQLIAEATSVGQAVSLSAAQRFKDRKDILETRSALAAPIFVRGQLHSCLLVVHQEVGNLFNETEQKLGDFITTIAGAALENADGFLQLQQLNETLEQRVEDRTGALKQRAQELAVANTKLKRIARDLTKTKTELADAKYRVEQASQAKSDFLATMSHEIRTPMNAVIGMTELCMATPLNNVQRSYLDVVKSSGSSLLTILNDILDLSKIEANKLELEEIPFDVRAVVDESCQLMSFNALGKDLEILYRVDPDIPLSLDGDPNRLQQIIVNLLGNAIKFTKTGEIFVDVNIAEQTDDSVILQFAVNDTGVGISKDKQQLIFDAFSQADSSTTREFGGTGLGLTITSRLTEMMQGRVWVESEVNQGSTFYFTANFSRNETSTDGQVGLEGRRVCIAVAQPRMRSILKELMEHWSAHVEVVSCQQLENDLRRQDAVAYDLALLDVDANLSDGRTLLDHLGESPAWSDVPTVGFFRKDHPDVIQASNSDLNVVFVSRPAGAVGIGRAIDDLLRGSPTSEPHGPADATKTFARPLHILLAEDVPINQQIALGFIERLGHNVTVAENGVDALQQLNAVDFDVVLMDVEMPEMDGVEATRQIRQHEKSRGGHIPIIAMTAHAIPDVKKRCLDAGMDDYLTKPLEPEKLQLKLDELQRLIQTVS